ncbi:SagB/ThcOx family dehydrogenase [Amycolatopsis pigmentata]|uniref:SagB/ThcOx family dehydrogenase n=1 Tax=Amycolatopsis pigmentata TaxID=450801 RepID=A0ABW5FN29_9PSEU
MTRSDLWDQLTGPAEPEEKLWCLFHENSKVTRSFLALPDEVVAARMRELTEALGYDHYPATRLPEPSTVDASLGEVMRDRASARDFRPASIGLTELSALLRHAYAVNRKGDVRSFRTTPSPGGLYPLELYLHSTRVDGLPSGLHHYHPVRGELRRLHEGDLARDLASCFVQGEIVYDATILIFLTAWFERVTFKYGDRGYRFALLEAGHVAQNLNLAAAALGLGAVNLGGFFDRELDDVLRLDGVTASTLYAVAIGVPGEESDE